MAKKRFLTRLFEREGKDNLADTIRIVAKAADHFNIRKTIVFTTSGESALSLRKKVAGQRNIVAVTFPHEMTATEPAGPTLMGIPSRKRRLEMEALGIPIVQGTMPFRVAADDNETFRAVRTAFGVLGGGVQLCVQAVMMACDAGHLDAGERCLAMSADTAIIMRAGHSWQFFLRASTLAIEHILCKPQYYQISRGDQELEIARYFAGQEIEATPEERNVTPKALPAESGSG